MTTQDRTLPEAALLLGRSYHAAWRLLMRGELGPVRQIAGRWLLDDSYIVEYLARTAAARASSSAGETSSL